MKIIEIGKIQFSEKELKMLLELTSEINIERNVLDFKDFYIRLAADVFEKNLTGYAVESFRRCLHAILKEGPKRLTEQFDFLIQESPQAV